MSGRSVVVLGASSGIGLATALRLARGGDRLVLAARDEPALQRAARRCREAGAADVHVVVADARDPASVRQTVSVAVEAHGRLDAAVHTATVMAYGTVERMPPEIYSAVVGTALEGTLHLAQAVVPLFRQQHRGTLVVVNSLLGSVTVPNMGAYSSAKWAQRALARTLQQELRGERGVHVCIVSPGSINTPIYYQAANYLGRAVRPPVPVLQPERAAGVVAGLLDRPRQHVSVTVGPLNPLVVIGFRLLPAIYDRLVSPLFRLAAQTRTPVAVTTGNVPDPVGEQDAVHGHWPAHQPAPDPAATAD